MAETDEQVGDAGRAGEGADLKAEEESAKAMEAEVPHPAGYADGGQEPPGESGEASAGSGEASGDAARGQSS